MEIVYFNGSYMPKSEVRISPDDRGFLFADGVYEVIRSYHGKLFHLKEHLDRLEYSLNAIRLRYDAISEIESIAFELINRNDLINKDATIYIQITRGAFVRTHHFPLGKVEPTVYMTTKKLTSDKNSIKNGIIAVTVRDTRWERCDIKSIALLPNVLAHQEAIEKGAAEGIFVKNEIITEGTHTSVFGIKDGKLLTHPSDENILPSITRGIVSEICNNLDLELLEIPIKLNDVNKLDELFIVGTTPEITPVIQLNETIIGNGKPGSITRLIQKEFRKLTN